MERVFHYSRNLRRRIDGFAVSCFVALGALAGRGSDTSDSSPGITVPVFVNDSWRTFVVDTGGGYSMVHPSLTNRLTQTPSRSILLGTGPSREVACFRGPAMLVSNVWTTADVVICPGIAPFKVWEERSGNSVDGVLGLDVLADFALLFDFGRGSVLFSTNLPYPLRCGLLLNVTPGGKFVFAASVANDQTIQIALDTAFEGGVSLNPTDWMKAFPTGPTNWNLVTMSDSLGDIFETLKASLPELRIGSEVFKNVQCTRGYSDDLPSVIGLELLHDCRVTIDYPNRTINLWRVATNYARRSRRRDGKF